MPFWSFISRRCFCAFSRISVAQSLLDVLMGVLYHFPRGFEGSISSSQEPHCLFTSSELWQMKLCVTILWSICHTAAENLGCKFHLNRLFFLLYMGHFQLFHVAVPGSPKVCSAPGDTSNWFFLLEFAMYFLQPVHFWAVSACGTHQVLHGPFLRDLPDVEMRVSCHAHPRLLHGKVACNVNDITCAPMSWSRRRYSLMIFACSSTVNPSVNSRSSQWQQLWRPRHLWLAVGCHRRHHSQFSISKFHMLTYSHFIHQEGTQGFFSLPFLVLPKKLDCRKGWFCESRICRDFLYHKDVVKQGQSIHAHKHKL